MNFDLSDEQQLLSDTLKRYLTKEYTIDARAKIVDSPTGWSETVWAALAEMGLLGVPFAEEHGGFGGTAVDVMLVMEALGEALVVEPYWVNVGLAGRLSAAALFFVNIVAVISYPALEEAGLIQHQLWGLLLLVPLLHGPGKLSLDHLISRRYGA